MADWLDEIEAQADETSPYYLPRLIAEIRRLRALADQGQRAVPDMSGLRTDGSGSASCRRPIGENCG